MKKLLVLTLVAAIASLANATLKISVNGVVDANLIMVGYGISIIDISASSQPANVGAVLSLYGKDIAILNITQAVNYVNPRPAPPAVDTIIDITGLVEGDQAIFADLAIPSIPIPVMPAKAVDLVVLYCGIDGYVLLKLWNLETGTVYDNKIIAIAIPEPISITLLALGGLLLSRRRRQ